MYFFFISSIIDFESSPFVIVLFLVMFAVSLIIITNLQFIFSVLWSLLHKAWNLFFVVTWNSTMFSLMHHFVLYNFKVYFNSKSYHSVVTSYINFIITVKILMILALTEVGTLWYVLPLIFSLANMSKKAKTIQLVYFYSPNSRLGTQRKSPVCLSKFLYYLIILCHTMLFEFLR